MVLIQKAGDLYSFTADGRALPQDETESFLEEFKPTKRKGVLNKNEWWFPKNAVRVGEMWDNSGDEEDGIKSTTFGRLTKVYRDTSGLQCGLVTIEGELLLPKEPNSPEKMTIIATYDGPIDGTSWHSKRTAKLTSGWLANHPKYGRVAAEMEIVVNTTTSAVN